MAWRDSRGSRRRLLLFLSSMVLGVAALVAINSFGESLEAAVNEQAKTLLGADLSFESDFPFDDSTEVVIDSLGGLQSRRISFGSMAYFPRTGSTRLASVRANEPGYPYYGAVETNPPEAADTYLQGRNALVDGALMNEFGVVVGDSVQIGSINYRVAGELLKTPRESAAMMLFSPRVYIPLAELDTSLTGFGSRVEYEVYFKFDDDRDVEAMMEVLAPQLRARDVGSDTVGEEQRRWGERVGNLYRFLGLVGFIALLLGGLGVASAVHVYVKQRLETVAVLRCVGATSRRTFWIYLIQSMLMGVTGATIGSLLGMGVQLLLPRVVGDFLPVEVDFAVSWTAVAIGFGVGVGVTLLFSLLPLLSVRRVSPLRAIRSAYEAEQSRDVWRWVLYGALGVALMVFAVFQAPDPVIGIGYMGGVVVVFGMLALVAKGLTVAARRFFPSGWPYVWRQGLANLYRPNNQTLLLMLALGLGTFLIVTLLLVERSLLEQFDVASDGQRPDQIMFDIQPNQVEGVTQILEAQDLPLIDQSPIVTMRIKEIHGQTLAELREDSTYHVNWAHNREYRSSYRSYLTEAETLLDGAFVGTVDPSTEVVPVSIERDLAYNELHVDIGDTLVWDVQGVDMTTVISSIREVDWQRMQTNFFVIFPNGVLEQAPQMHVFMTQTGNDEKMAALQEALVQQFPNVSTVSLSLVLAVFDEIFSRVSFVIRFMALFSILTGLIVLAGAVLVSRFQRIEESVLLKTLGASRKQVLRIMIIEYLFLGVFATITGVVLAYAASWSLAEFVFQTPLVTAPIIFLLALVIVTGLTIIIGLLNSRGIYARPPLEVLRAEV